MEVLNSDATRLAEFLDRVSHNLDLLRTVVAQGGAVATTGGLSQDVIDRINQIYNLIRTDEMNTARDINHLPNTPCLLYTSPSPRDS